MVKMNLTDWSNAEDELCDKGNDEFQYITNSVDYKELPFIATGANTLASTSIF